MTALLYSNARAGEGVHTLISPGDLAKSHAKYEGIKNCTQCHRLGGGLPDGKCLDCHDKLAARIKSKQGTHAKYTDACVKCHGDHKGRSFRMINVDEKGFDHDRTDYLLRDKHARAKCKDCHKKEGVYSGLKQDCVSCHKDEHKGQLANKCESCHNIKGWKEIEKFDHDRDSSYALTSKHREVKCAKCHAKGRYKPVDFKKCDDCHKDPHRGQFRERKCDSCHNTRGWAKDAFDHASPGYKGYRLDGKHLKVDCAKCHAKGRYKPVAYKACDDCHKDPHRGQFKEKKCEQCHTTAAWDKDAFDHASQEYKGYKLSGKHRDTKCDKCHVNGKYRPLAYKLCDDCHKDPHERQLRDKACEACHTTNEWKKVIFDHNAPQYSKYRLEGKHEKTVCSKCHVKGRYKPLEEACLACHEKEDVHKKDLGKVCEKCHTPADWKKSTMNHNTQTRFPLVGAHKNTDCSKCHKRKDMYKEKERRCEDCHKDPHKGEFKEECASCHTQNDWAPRKFDHSRKAGFELKGAHNDAACKSCHIAGGAYRKVSRYCNQCHADPHFNQFGGKQCTQCHGETSWGPTEFSHGSTGYPLSGSHRSVECSACHANRLYRNTAAVCASCHRTDFASAPGHAAGGYSQDCTKCHLSNISSWNFSHAGSGNCASCHLDRRPASHTADPSTYPMTCEICHTSTSSWTEHRHASATNCGSCHLGMRPSSHTANTSKYPAACELCHSYPSWTATRHLSTSNCGSCHLGMRPSSHTANTTKYPVTCELCHSYPSWTATRHLSTSTNCGSCHLSSRPASHTADPATYPTTCELCHTSTSTWTEHRHTTAKTGCSSCHLSTRPSSHTANPSAYPTTCELCHAYPSWAFTHSSSSSVNCNNCHSGVTPAPHKTYASRFGTLCQNCHTYPSWLPGKMNHSFTVFPTNHQGFSRCSDCHPAQNYGNKGGCIECHTARGEKVHKTTSNAGCLSCHPYGRE